MAAEVRGLPDPEESAGNLTAETIRTGSPRNRTTEEPQDYLFVWGYRPELYYWSGLLPASRYLSSQPITGVPADVHFFGGLARPILGPAETELARSKLMEDLNRTRPKYVIDELGAFNAEFGIDSIPELAGFIQDYRQVDSTPSFILYCRRDLTKKALARKAENDNRSESPQ